MNKQMMRRLTSFASPLMLAVVSVSAFQAQALAQEKPLPEHQRLAEWIGDWTYVVGEGSGTVTWEWFGDFFVRSSEVNTNSSGETMRILGMMGYDAEEGVYTLNRFFDSGYRDAAKVRVDGNTWTFILDESDDVKWRATVVRESPDAFTIKWERSVKDGPWEVTSEGRATKAT